MLHRWAQLVRRGLARAGLEASVAVGHTRFGTWALARERPGVQVLPDAAAEWAAARQVPLARLALDPEARDTLARLGVRRVGGLVHLPAEGLRRRFGDGVAVWHSRLTTRQRSEGGSRIWARSLTARRLGHPRRQVPRRRRHVGRRVARAEDGSNKSRCSGPDSPPRPAH